MGNRIKLVANEGMVLTNGEIYGATIFLAENVNAEDFYEITKAEYEKMLEEQNKEIF